MAEYRLYFHNEDGGIQRVEALDVFSDAIAFERARLRQHEYVVEVCRDGLQLGIVNPGEA
jgi:hypothetical protein